MCIFCILWTIKIYNSFNLEKYGKDIKFAFSIFILFDLKSQLSFEQLYKLYKNKYNKKIIYLYI